jgi:hypothetical protein
MDLLSSRQIIRRGFFPNDFDWVNNSAIAFLDLSLSFLANDCSSIAGMKSIK